MNHSVDLFDTETAVFYLTVPRDKIVLLQGFMDLYEGVGVVRTLDVASSLACIITTGSLVSATKRVLEEIQPEIGWTAAPIPDSDSQQRYFQIFCGCSWGLGGFF